MTIEFMSNEIKVFLRRNKRQSPEAIKTITKQEALQLIETDKAHYVDSLSIILIKERRE